MVMWVSWKAKAQLACSRQQCERWQRRNRHCECGRLLLFCQEFF